MKNIRIMKDSNSKTLNVLEGSGYENTRWISKSLNLKINNKPFTLPVSAAINMWGINEADRDKVYAKILDKEDGLYFFAKAEDIQCPHFVCGYPSIKIGKSPWDKYAEFEWGQIKEYSKMKILTEWYFKLNGTGNLTYDVWLTKNKDGRLTKDDIEIMVWLGYNQKPTYWKSIGNCKGFEVYYKRKSSEWNNGGHVFAFVHTKSKDKVNFNMKELILYCKKEIKDINNYWLRTIELGTEFNKNTQVEIKVSKMNFNFIKK